MAIDNTQKPPTHHVLIVTLSAQGHMNPLLRLGKRLHSKGLHVTLATTDIFRHRHVLSHSSPLEIPGVHLEFFSDGISLEGDRSDKDYYFECLNLAGPINLSALIQDLDSRPIPKISCIIGNPFLPWVADVAALHRIPSAMMWIQPCSILSIYYRFYNNLDPFHDNVSSEAVDVPGLPLLHTVDLPSFILPSNTEKSFAVLLSQCIKSTDKYKWILANSFDELEKESIKSLSGLIPVIPVGPLVPGTLLSHDHDNGHDDSGNLDMWKADESCIEWLDEQAPHSVIYVSFGSLLSLPKDTMESIAKALKMTKRPFLWVAKTPEGALSNIIEATGEQGRVVVWAPQSRVLKHSAIGCFLTHCGWNSVLESVSSGVPLVCYPQWTDQPTNAKLVVDLFKVGVRLWPNKEGGVEAEEVERCLEEVMVGPAAEAIRARAGEWSRVAREALAEGGSSDRNIQWFVDEIVKSSV